MFVVPEFRGNPKVLASNAGFHQPRERSADCSFVRVDRGAVEMTVAHLSGVFNGGRDLGGGDVIGAKGTEANGRHTRSRVQGALRNERGIDCIFYMGHIQVTLAIAVAAPFPLAGTPDSAVSISMERLRRMLIFARLKRKGRPIPPPLSVFLWNPKATIKVWSQKKQANKESRTAAAPT